MNPIINWFLMANIAFVTLYLFYRLLLHRDTFFREKRFAFLLCFLFALLHPLIDISSWIENNQEVIIVAQSISTTLPEIVVSGESNFTLSTQELLLLAYGIIAGFLLIRIVWQTISVLLLALRGRKEEINGLQVINLHEGTAPFSFFGMIFLNPDDYSSKDLEEILHHEGAHVRQLHTLDVIFAELICALFWINPTTWLLKRHMRENLEYLADNDVLHSGFDPKSYQYHLLRLSYQQSTTNMANHFNVTQLKKRIIMMNKKKTSLVGLGKYALSLPLFAFLLFAAYALGANTELHSLNEMAEVAMNNITNDKPMDVSSPKKDAKIASVNAKTFDNTGMNFSVEKMAGFPGGEGAFMRFLMQNVHYPLTAKEAGIQGRVVARFIINENGDVKNIEVLESLDPSCDEEAVRVLKLMPKWTPKIQDSKKIGVTYTVPIIFRLADVKAVQYKKDQSNNKVYENKTNEMVVIGYSKPKETPYTTVEVMPQFPGGQNAMMKYILDNLRYPASARDAGIEGRVIARFIVSKTGEVTDVEVMRGLYPACDEEAMRVINSMPNWTPGKQGGKEVPVFFTIPIVYQLTKGDSNKNLGLLNIKHINGKEPLIILDGVEYKREIKDINPNDIYKIDVLKEDSLKAIYGKKGANGVIVITLKKSQNSNQ